MAWNKVGMSSGGNGTTKDDYIRLTDGQKVRIHVLLDQGEEPYSYFSVFIGPDQKSKRTVIIGPENENHEAITQEKKRAKHAVNVWDYQAKRVRILDAGNRLMEEIKNIWETYGQSLDTVDLVINKKGTGLATEWHATPVPSAFAKVDVSGITKFNMEDVFKPSTEEYIASVVNGGSDFNFETPTEEKSAEIPAEGDGFQNLPELAESAAEPYVSDTTEETMFPDEGNVATMAPPKPTAVKTAPRATATPTKTTAAPNERTKYLELATKGFATPKFTKNHPKLRDQVITQITKSKQYPKGKQWLSQCSLEELKAIVAAQKK